MDADGSGIVDFGEFIKWFLNEGLKRKRTLKGRLLAAKGAFVRAGGVRNDARVMISNVMDNAARHSCLESLMRAEEREGLGTSDNTALTKKFGGVKSAADILLFNWGLGFRDILALGFRV